MANVIQFTVKAKDLTGGALNSVNTGLGKMGNAVKGVAGHIFSLKGLIAGAGIGVLGKSFVDAANTTEQLGIRLNIMLGSAKEGNKVFQDMTKFAAQVPFEYEEIMNSATMLAGILKGGSDEINQWMPLIGDLAATTGLSIQETTEQVQRMLGGGAAAADKFRERGVLSMLGFEQGVAVSADETKKKLMEAWDGPLSKFRGATDKLATTWDGTLSMIGDKWFAIRSFIMDAGLMNFFKAIARTIDQYVGKALDVTKENGKAWAETIINATFSIIDVVAKLVDTFDYLKIAWAGLKVAFATIAEFIVTKLYNMAEGVRSVINLIPGINIGPFETLNEIVGDLSGRTEGFLQELDALVKAPLSSENIVAFKNAIIANLKIVTAETKKAKEDIASGGEGFKDTRSPAEQEISSLTSGGAYDKAISQLDSYLGTRTAKLRMQNATESELMRAKYESDMLAAEEAFIRGLDTEEQRNQARLEIQAKYDNDMLVAAGFTAQTYNDIWASATQTFTKGIGDAVANAIIEQKSMGEAMKSIMKSVASQVISSLVQIGIKMLVQRQTQTAALALTAGTVSATAAGIAAASAPAAALTSLMSFGGNSAPAIAGMTAATTAAKGLAVFSQAHSGITNVSKDATFELQAGERVVKRDQNRDLTNFLARGGSGQGQSQGAGITIENFNIEISGRDLMQMNDSEVQQMLADKFIPNLDALSKQGIRQRDFSYGE